MGVKIREMAERVGIKISGNSSIGRASAFQADGHGFDARFPLQNVAKAKRSLTFTIEAKNNAGQPVVVLGRVHSPDISEVVRFPSPAPIYTVEKQPIMVLGLIHIQVFGIGSNPIFSTTSYSISERSVVRFSAPGLGPGGREFESLRSDHSMRGFTW